MTPAGRSGTGSDISALNCFRQSALLRIGESVPIKGFPPRVARVLASQRTRGPVDRAHTMQEVLNLTRLHDATTIAKTLVSKKVSRKRLVSIFLTSRFKSQAKVNSNTQTKQSRSREDLTCVPVLAEGMSVGQCAFCKADAEASTSRRVANLRRAILNSRREGAYPLTLSNRAPRFLRLPSFIQIFHPVAALTSKNSGSFRVRPAVPEGDAPESSSKSWPPAVFTSPVLSPPLPM